MSLCALGGFDYFSLMHGLQNRLIPSELLFCSTSLRLSSILQACATVKTTIVLTQYTFLFCIENTSVSCCCNRKSRAACAQSFALWQQATIEITRRDHSITACSRHI